MLDEEIKDGIEGLFKDIDSKAEEVVALGLGFAKDTTNISDYLVDSVNFADDVATSCSAVTSFQKDFVLTVDEGGEICLVMWDDTVDETEGVPIRLEAQIYFVVTEKTVEFQLNIFSAGGGELNKSYESLPQELFEMVIDTSIDDMQRVAQFAKNLRDTLKTRGQRMAETSATLIADTINEEFMPLEELDKYR